MAVSTPTVEQLAQRERTLLYDVYGWMTGGLLITALVSLIAYRSPTVHRMFIAEVGTVMGLAYIQTLVVTAITLFINKLSAEWATSLLVVYAVLNGLVLSGIFWDYTKGAVAAAFFVCSGMFATMSVIGRISKADLAQPRSFFVMGMIGLALASAVNLTLASSALYGLITYAGVGIFMGLAMAGAQKIKVVSARVDHSDAVAVGKLPIVSALMLYLDLLLPLVQLMVIYGDKEQKKRKRELAQKDQRNLARKLARKLAREREANGKP